MSTRSIGRASPSLLLPLLGLLLAPPLPAQPAADSPEAFAATYIAAASAAEWPRVAALMHPEALARFKELFGPIVELDTSGEVAGALFEIEGAEAFRRTPADRLFATLMRSMVSMMPEFAAVLAGAESEMIGHVTSEAENAAYVVYRVSLEVEGIRLRQLDVMPVRRHGGEWRALLTGDIEGLAAALARQVEETELRGGEGP